MSSLKWSTHAVGGDVLAVKIVSRLEDGIGA